MVELVEAAERWRTAGRKKGRKQKQKVPAAVAGMREDLERGWAEVAAAPEGARKPGAAEPGRTVAAAEPAPAPGAEAGGFAGDAAGEGEPLEGAGGSALVAGRAGWRR